MTPEEAEARLARSTPNDGSLLHALVVLVLDIRSKQKDLDQRTEDLEARMTSNYERDKNYRSEKLERK